MAGGRAARRLCRSDGRSPPAVASGLAQDDPGATPLGRCAGVRSGPCWYHRVGDDPVRGSHAARRSGCFFRAASPGSRATGHPGRPGRFARAGAHGRAATCAVSLGPRGPFSWLGATSALRVRSCCASLLERQARGRASVRVRSGKRYLHLRRVASRARLPVNNTRPADGKDGVSCAPCNG